MPDVSSTARALAALWNKVTTPAIRWFDLERLCGFILTPPAIVPAMSFHWVTEDHLAAIARVRKRKVRDADNERYVTLRK